MKQASKAISTYTSDISGVCSAMYELGGMTVMHDPSGCNSTYNTHDEPRWYDMDSLVFISGLVEMDAIMGTADDKLIDDCVMAAEEFSPRFITIAGATMPMVFGCDFNAVARLVEQKTKIPTIGLDTNGMHSYIQGAAKAFEAYAGRFCKNRKPEPLGKHPNINLLGVTPLDFSVNGSVESLCSIFEDNGYHIIGCWAMNCNPKQLENAAAAHVNVVVSACGLAVAKFLHKKFGTPYVIGLPIGAGNTKYLFEVIDKVAKNQKPLVAFKKEANINKSNKKILIVGESVYSNAVRTALEDRGMSTCFVVSTLETQKNLLREDDLFASSEDELEPIFKDADIVIADPTFKFMVPSTAKFVSLGHEASSGRIYRENIPNIIGEKFNKWYEENFQ